MFFKKKILPILTKSKNYSENWSNFKTIPQQLLANNWKYSPLIRAAGKFPRGFQWGKCGKKLGRFSQFYSWYLIFLKKNLLKFLQIWKKIMHQKCNRKGRGVIFQIFKKCLLFLKKIWLFHILDPIQGLKSCCFGMRLRYKIFPHCTRIPAEI